MEHVEWACTRLKLISKANMKKIVLIFTTAFVLNVLWENAHSVLYAKYMGNTITEFILLRAALFDACVITLLALPFFYIQMFKKRPWLILVLGVLIGICNEWYGLNTGRWVYTSTMPIIPILKTGLTPTLQLGILGYISLVFGLYLGKKKTVLDA